MQVDQQGKVTACAANTMPHVEPTLQPASSASSNGGNEVGQTYVVCDISLDRASSPSQHLARNTCIFNQGAHMYMQSEPRGSPLSGSLESPKDTSVFLYASPYNEIAF